MAKPLDRMKNATVRSREVHAGSSLLEMSSRRGKDSSLPANFQDPFSAARFRCIRQSSRYHCRRPRSRVRCCHTKTHLPLRTWRGRWLSRAAPRTAASTANVPVRLPGAYCRVRRFHSRYSPMRVIMTCNNVRSRDAHPGRSGEGCAIGMSAERGSAISSGASRSATAPLRLLTEQAFSRTAGAPLLPGIFAAED